MSFLSPILFWSFLLLIPLVAVYFLKVRPRKQPTTALFLWQSIYQKKQTNSLFNKLRDLLSLLLMALIFILLTLAMAGPELSSGQDKDLLLIIDNSASMAVREGSSTRLDQAKEQARKIIMALGAGHRAAIAVASDAMEYKTFMSDNQRLLARAIDDIDQTELAFDADNLEKTLATGVDSSQLRSILITDAAAIPLGFGQNAAGQTPALEVMKVGGRAENIGFVACDLQIQKNNPEQMSFYYQLAADTEELVETQISLYYLGDEIADISVIDRDYLTEEYMAGRISNKVIPVSVLPGLNKPEIFTIPIALSGRWLAVLDHSDSLAVDNSVALAVNKPKPVQVCVCAQEEYFFSNCVAAFAQSSQLITLVSSSAVDNGKLVYLCQTIQDYEHLVAQNPSAAVRAIVFSPAVSEGLFSGQAGELETGTFAVRPVIEDEPALRFYDVSTIAFYGALNIKPVPSAQVLAETDTGIGLIWRMTNAASDSYFVNMNPAEGDFYYNPYFPVMVFRMALSLAGTELLDSAALSSNDLLHRSNILRADQKAAKEGWLFADKLLPTSALCGFYTTQTDNETGFVGCGLLSSSESMVNPVYVPDTLAPIKKGHSIAYWLIVLALIMAVAECLLYHRRKLG